MAIIEAIATTYLETTSVSSMSFTSIPSTYEHLQVCFSLKLDDPSTYGEKAIMQLNGDTGSNYSSEYLYGYNGTYKYADPDHNEAKWTFPTIAAQQDSTGSTYSVFVVDIFDYAHTSKNASMSWFSGCNRAGRNGLLSVNGQTDTTTGGGVWDNTAAVDEILVGYGSTNLMRGSCVSLYGINSS